MSYFTGIAARIMVVPNKQKCIARTRYPKTIIIPACFLTRGPSNSAGRKHAFPSSYLVFTVTMNQVPKDCPGPLLAKVRRDRQHLADGFYIKAVLGRVLHIIQELADTNRLAKRATTCAASLQSNGGLKK